MFGFIPRGWIMIGNSGKSGAVAISVLQVFHSLLSLFSHLFLLRLSASLSPLSLVSLALPSLALSHFLSLPLPPFTPVAIGSIHALFIHRPPFSARSYRFTLDREHRKYRKLRQIMQYSGRKLAIIFRPKYYDTNILGFLVIVVVATFAAFATLTPFGTRTAFALDIAFGLGQQCLTR